jgi:phosphoribosylanthranilate isomerase
MTKVKICGITNLADAKVAVTAGADLLGFIFYEPSPRYVSPERVKQIITALEQEGLKSPGRGPQWVGVFVNGEPEWMAQVVAECGLDRLQLHGEEPPAVLAQFPAQAFKAMRPQSYAEAESMVAQYLPTVSPACYPYFLLDAYHPALYGGTGQVTDWRLAATIARRYPIMLAGSLTRSNVTEAIAAVRPWGVDVSSGVEAEKGRKDHAALRDFIAAVRAFDQE